MAVALTVSATIGLALLNRFHLGDKIFAVLAGQSILPLTGLVFFNLETTIQFAPRSIQILGLGTGWFGRHGCRR